MKNIFGALCSGLAILLFFSMTSCSSTKKTRAWVDPAYNDGPLVNVMVVGMCENEQVRTVYEERLTKLFINRGIDAKSSAQCFVVGQELDDEFVLAEMKRLGIEAVLVSDILAVRVEEHVIPGRGSQPQYSALFNALGAKFYTEDEAEAYKSKKDIKNDLYHETHFHVHSKLFEADTGRKIWQMQVETRNPQKDLGKSMESIGRLIINNLAKENLI